MPPPLSELADDLVGEIFLRLPPDEPTCLLRASLTCKRWRRILADPAFRRRHRAIHRTPPVVGFLRIVNGDAPYASRFVPINPASGRPAGRDLPGWLVLDCRHGRALFATLAPDAGTEGTLDFVVWDPLTNGQHRLPRPSPPPTDRVRHLNATVLCAAATEGCDHRDCHEGAFRVAFVWTHSADLLGRNVTSARVYSSETGDWSEMITVQHPNACVDMMPSHSVLVGDTIYFHSHGMYAFEYQLGAQRLSIIYRPPPSLYEGIFIFLMSTEDGELGCIDVEEEPSLCIHLWSREAAPDGVARWAQGRAIKLESLLPDGALLAPRLPSVHPPPPTWMVSVQLLGFAEGTDIIFVATWLHGHRGAVYMFHLNSGRARKVSEDRTLVFPCTSFCIPVQKVKVCHLATNMHGRRKMISVLKKQRCSLMALGVLWICISCEFAFSGLLQLVGPCTWLLPLRA